MPYNHPKLPPDFIVSRKCRYCTEKCEQVGYYSDNSYRIYKFYCPRCEYTSSLYEIIDRPRGKRRDGFIIEPLDVEEFDDVSDEQFFEKNKGWGPMFYQPDMTDEDFI